MTVASLNPLFWQQYNSPPNTATPDVAKIGVETRLIRLVLNRGLSLRFREIVAVREVHRNFNDDVVLANDLDRFKQSRSAHSPGEEYNNG